MKHHLTGFTLIEVLFVVAILAVTAALGLDFYQQTAESSKVDNTALQMQQILQAGSTYYIAQGNVWPANADPTFIKEYVPVFNNAADTPQNPWGDGYSWDNPSAYLFEVTTIVPSAALADQIAAHLPNAVPQDTTAPYSVKADVAAPGQSSAPPAAGNGSGFAGGGTAPGDGSSPAIFDCPTGTTPQLMTSLSSFSVQWIGSGVGAWPIQKMSISESPTDCLESGAADPANANMLQYSCGFTVTLTNSTKVDITLAGSPPQVSWMAVCIKPAAKQMVLL